MVNWSEWRGQERKLEAQGGGRSRDRLQERASQVLCWLKCGCGVGPNILKVKYDVGRN